MSVGAGDEGASSCVYSYSYSHPQGLYGGLAADDCIQDCFNNVYPSIHNNQATCKKS